MKKIDDKIKELIEQGKIKTKWSELECHGASEFLNMLFQEQVQYGSLAQSIIVENRVVCINILDGVFYDGEALTRMYITGEDHVLFMARNGNLYIYETEGVDAGDMRHYFGRD